MKFFFAHGETSGNKKIKVPENVKFCSQPGDPVDMQRTRTILRPGYIFFDKDTFKEWPELELTPVTGGQENAIQDIARAAAKETGTEVRVSFIPQKTKLSAWLDTLKAETDDVVLVCCSNWSKTTSDQTTLETQNRAKKQKLQGQSVINALDDSSYEATYTTIARAREKSVTDGLKALETQQSTDSSFLSCMRLSKWESLALDLQCWTVDPSGKAEPSTWPQLLELVDLYSEQGIRNLLRGKGDWGMSLRNLAVGLSSTPTALRDIIDGNQNGRNVLPARKLTGLSEVLRREVEKFQERTSKVLRPANYVNTENPNDLKAWEAFLTELEKVTDLLPVYPQWRDTVNFLPKVAVSWGVDFQRGYADALKLPRVRKVLTESPDAQLQELISKCQPRKVARPSFVEVVEDLKKRHAPTNSVLATPSGERLHFAILWDSMDASSLRWNMDEWEGAYLGISVAPWTAMNAPDATTEKRMCKVKWAEEWFLEVLEKPKGYLGASEEVLPVSVAVDHFSRMNSVPLYRWSDHVAVDAEIKAEEWERVKFEAARVDPMPEPLNGNNSVYEIRLRYWENGRERMSPCWIVVSDSYVCSEMTGSVQFFHTIFYDVPSRML